MACDRKPKDIPLDLESKRGRETEAKAKEDAEKAAKRKILEDPEACTGSCEGGKCIRIAVEKDIQDAIKTYRYDDNDGDQSWGWYIDATLKTRCVCAHNAKK